MLAIDRRGEILDRIQQEGSVKVPELSAEFKVTEETIRRDLEKLEAEGHITRTYGGAVLNKGTSADLSHQYPGGPESGRKKSNCQEGGGAHREWGYHHARLQHDGPFRCKASKGKEPGDADHKFHPNSG